jgi:hypothetical protein
MLTRLYIFLLLFGSFSITAQAATLYIDPGISSLNRSDSVTMSVRLMPDSKVGECINAVEAVISYTDNIQPVDVSIGGSIFNVWVEPPTINKEDHTITFAGGIPNGYCGRVQGDPRLTNVIADIIFRSPGFQIGTDSDDTEAVIDFTSETKAYVNDGQGSKAPLRLLGSKITLDKNAGAIINDEWREEVKLDDSPPEKFSITLTRDEVAFSGKYFIVFDTTDKQTGVSHYEVIEDSSEQFGVFTWGEAGAPWVRTNSPYVLKDQSLNSVVRVRAVDKAGNEYVATLVPDKSLRTATTGSVVNYFVFASALMILVIIGGAVWYVSRRKRRSELSSEEVIPNEIND